MGRCVQYTRYGEICVAECGGKEKKYNWCLTNSIKIGDGVGEGYWWEYCSLVGYTIKKAECVDECARHGERYWWCHTSQHGGGVWSWWDYCSPSPNITINQAPCTDSCEKRGSSYYWCHSGVSWDYCSPLYTQGGFSYESVTAASNSHSAINLILIATQASLIVRYILN